MTHSHLSLSIVLGLGLIVAGCGLHTETTPLNAPPRPLFQRVPETVSVLATPPSQRHVAIAMIEVEPRSSLSRKRTDKLLAEARKKAGQLGCDALLLQGVQSRGPGPDSVLLDTNIDRKGLVASCLVYEPESPANGRIVVGVQR